MTEDVKVQFGVDLGTLPEGTKKASDSIKNVAQAIKDTVGASTNWADVQSRLNAGYASEVAVRNKQAEAIQKLREHTAALVKNFQDQQRVEEEASRQKKMETHLDGISRASEKLIGWVKGLVVAYAGYKLLDQIRDSAMLAARYEELGVVMKVVGNNAGYTSIQMEEYAKQVEAAGISMNISRQIVVTLAQAQIDLADASKLARIAQDAAVIGQTDSSHALERMVYGIKSAQVEVLRTIGINVSFEQGYKKLADQLKISTSDLSEAQKMQSRKNQVMEEGIKLVGTYEASMTTAGKQIRSVQRYTDDLKTILGETFNEALTVAVMGFVDSLKSATTESKNLKENGDLIAWGEGVSDLMFGMADNVLNLGNAYILLGKTIGAAMAQARAFFSFGGKQKMEVITEEYSRDMEKVLAREDMLTKALEKRRAALAAAKASGGKPGKEHVADFDGDAQFEKSGKSTAAAKKAADAKKNLIEHERDELAKSYQKYYDDAEDLEHKLAMLKVKGVKDNEKLMESEKEKLEESWRKYYDEREEMEVHIGQVRLQQMKKAEEAEKAHIEKVSKSFKSMLEPLANAMHTTITGIITGTQSMGQAVDRIAQSIVLSFADAGVKMLVDWTATQLAMKQVAAGSNGIGGLFGDVLKGFGFGGAPTTAAPAVAPFFDVVPGYAMGTDFVKEDGLAYLHRGEKVVDAANNARGSSNSAASVVVNFNGVKDMNSFRQSQGEMLAALGGAINRSLSRNR